MTGYTRTDSVNNIADGNIINASDLDGEFDAVQAAFNSSTGHVHDGTAANGAPITKIGPTQDVVASADSAHLPSVFSEQFDHFFAGHLGTIQVLACIVNCWMAEYFPGFIASSGSSE